MRRYALPAVLAAVLLAGCSAETGDRSGGNGSRADEVKDVDSVEVFRNIDDYPNIARVCIDGVAFATTTRSDTAGPSMVRVVEWDSTCPAR